MYMSWCNYFVNRDRNTVAREGGAKLYTIRKNWLIPARTPTTRCFQEDWHSRCGKTTLFWRIYGETRGTAPRNRCIRGSELFARARVCNYKVEAAACRPTYACAIIRINCAERDARTPLRTIIVHTIMLAAGKIVAKINLKDAKHPCSECILAYCV